MDICGRGWRFRFVPKAEISDSAPLTHRDRKKSIFQL
jgi:hypothetical protein